MIGELLNDAAARTRSCHLFAANSASTLVDEGVSPDAAITRSTVEDGAHIVVEPPPQGRMRSSTDEHRSMAVSFWKAEQLLALATLVAARHAGITLDDVIERFSVSKRTAQRMLRALEAQFTDTNVSTDGEGRKRWHLPSGALRDLMSLSPEELAALDIAIETLKRSGLAVEADDLLSLREKILALVPRSKAARLETDHEALLEAQGLAARPGPRQRIDRRIAAAIAEAIKACRILEVEYQSRDEPAPRMRRLAPYGLLTGLRRYLLARPEDDPTGPVRLYVVESIRAANSQQGAPSCATPPSICRPSPIAPSACSRTRRSSARSCGGSHPEPPPTPAASSSTRPRSWRISPTAR